jgi:hypothetical protein
MAKALAFNYIFNPAADSVTIDGNIPIKRMLLITNVTDNIVIQNFADPARKILSRSYDSQTDETTFVLQYDCASMSATDNLQIFFETDAIKFQPSETFVDPVSKMRVSQPNTLIDTDFEYGLQATKWETLERLNQIPAFHSVSGDTPLSNILEVTTNGTNIVTVTTSSPHGLTIGFPIDVRGVDSPTAEGTFIVKRTSDITFSYEARAVQAGTALAPVSILTSYVNITPGRFYVGSQIPLDDTVSNTTGPIVTNGATPSIITAKTSYTHGMSVSSTFYLVNTLGNSSLSFSAISAAAGGDVDDRSSVSLSTGNFSMYEPFHDGTRRVDILDSAVDTTNETLTIPNHGMLTGDMIAYVGVSQGGASPQVASVVGGSYPISAGNLPAWAAGTGADGKMLYVVKINANTIRLATNPRDAYNSTNLIGFTGTGSGTLTFAHFRRGADIEEYISTITSTSGSSELVVTLVSGFTNELLKIIPEQQFTIAESALSALNGVYYVKSTGWDKDASTFTIIGPTNSTGSLLTQGATATYTMVNTGGNNTTTFDRYDELNNTGMRILLHTSPMINHMRASMHDWKSTTAKFFTRECISSNEIFIKNHGLTVGQPVMLILGGNTLSGATAADQTVYFVRVETSDTISLMTTETGSAGSTGPYSATVGSTAATFGTLTAATSLAGGVYSIHPGFQIASFTSQTVSGGNGTGRDRAIGKFTTAPANLYEGVPIVLKTGAGATLPTPIVATPDTYTSYQKYYVRTVLSADNRLEFSLGLQAKAGPLVEITGATTPGTGGFFGFRIDENPYSNSFYLKNHGGVVTAQTVGATGLQGTYPQGIGYPGVLFDRIVDPGTGYNGLPRVRATLTQTTPIGGLTSGTIYNMVPITNDIFKVMAWSDTALPTGQPTVQFTNVASRTSTVVFANSATVNVNANRIVIPSQRLGQLTENSVVRYRSNGNLDIPSSYTGWPGLINNNQYIIRNVVSSSFFELGLFTTLAYSATATTLVLNDATGLTIGDTLKITTYGTQDFASNVSTPIQYGEGTGGWGTTIVDNNELLLITNLVGATLTVTRGYRNTTALPIAAQTFVQKEFASFQLFATEQTLPRALNSLGGTTATNLYLATAHGLRTGDTIYWQSGTSGNPAWITNFPYYAVVSDVNNFGIADSLVLAQAAVLHDVNATTATSWTQFYSSVPLAGQGSSPLGSHSLEDTSATGTIDGGYTASAVTANTLQFTSATTIPNRSFTFYPEDALDLLTGEFFIRNHGFSTGTKVTYTKNALTNAIGDGVGNPVSGYNRLTNNTEYFVIRTSLNSFKLATTRANALAGTAIIRYSSPGTSGGHTLTSSQISGESLQGGLATIIARDIVVNGSDNFIVQAGADRIISTGHGFRSGDRVIYQVWGGGRQINGLVSGRQYFISNSLFGGTQGGAAAGQTANQFSLHNTWVGAYTNTDRADILGPGAGRVHQFKVTNPTMFGTTFKGEWSTADSYRAGDVVLFRNSYYMSVTGSDFATGTVVFNTGRQPTTESGQIETNWMPCPVLPAYGTTFLTEYRGGSRVRLSNNITRTTRFFNAGDSARVIVADDRINFAQVHGLFSGQAVIYRTDAKGGWHAGTAGTATPYRGSGGFVPQTAINGLVANRIYYVNFLGASDITLHTSPPLAVRGGSGDSGNFDFAVELTSLGQGEFHRFEVVNNVVYDMEVLAVTNNAEMIVSDPYPSRSITFNPQETSSHVSGLAMQVVDIALDVLYIPNHGLDTGVKVYYSAGVIGSGTAIGGLTDGTAYFVINLTPDHIRLASTIVNAYTGVQIDLTGTGTGILHYLIAATTSGSSWIRYNATGDINTDTTGLIANSNPYSSQVVGNIRDGVLIGLPILGNTEIYPRPDCTNVHRPFDGGVEINAGRSPQVSIVRQTRKYFRYQSGKGLQYSTGINFSPSIEVSRIVHDGLAWATVTTRKPHKLSAGNKVKVVEVGYSSEDEAQKCERDLGYLIDGVQYDVTLGTNYNSIFLGIAEVNSLELANQGVIRNITLTKQEVGELTPVLTDGTALSRSNAFFDEVLDIVQNGRAAANAVSYTNPSDATASRIAAKDKLVANKAFIAAEVNAWVAINYPNSQHDVAKCTRDVGYLVDAVGYDILYGGNSATYDVAKFYFYVYDSKKPGTSALHRAQTVAAYERIAAFIDDIVTGTSFVKSVGNALFQDTTGSNANSGDAAVVVGLVNIVVNTIDEVSQAAALAALPTKVYPSVTWSAAGLQSAKTAIAAAKTTIIADVVRGLYYTTPADGPYFLVDATSLTDFTFRYRTTAVPADLQPAGYPSLFVYSWDDAAVRAGMYDDQNGLFYEYDGQSLYCVRRNSTKQLGGVVAVTRNSNTITGTNTNFTRQLDVNDFIVIRGQSYKVTKITSDTVIEVSPKYRGTTRTKVIATKTEEVRFAQHEWSIDVCDGTGPTGFNLDINKMQMAYIDFSWYGAGKVRFGFKGADGQVIYVHEIKHNNREIEAYMRSGNLPARYEIVNGVAPTYAPSLYHWGASVIMDGGFEDDKAYLFTVASGSGGSDTITIPTSLAGIPVPVLSIRLAPSVDSSIVGALGERDLINRMSITLKQVGLVVTQTTRPASVRLILNGALAQQAYFSNYGSPSLTQLIKHTGQATDSITGGVTIYEFRAAANSPVTAELEALAEIGNSILGGDYVYPNGPDILTVAVVTTDTTTASQITARITWSESQA